MGPIRNPRWEQKRTEGYTLSYLVDDMSKIRQVLFKVGMSKQRSSKLLTTIAYPSRASEFTIWFLEVSYCYIFSFLCSVVIIVSFVILHLHYTFLVRFTAPDIDHHFGTFKLFLKNNEFDKIYN